MEVEGEGLVDELKPMLDAEEVVEFVRFETDYLVVVAVAAADNDIDSLMTVCGWHSFHRCCPSLSYLWYFASVLVEIDDVTCRMMNELNDWDADS
jgi:hypothetical protein